VAGVPELTIAGDGLREPAEQLAASTATASAEQDYLRRNRAAWDGWAARGAVTGRQAWHDVELRWGMWGFPERHLDLLHGLTRTTDVIELGCGAAALSAWVARAGARVVAVDFSPRQIATAERLRDESNVDFPLLCAYAEEVPFDDDSFDLAISEYGPSLWSDPDHWLPEAARLLRPGGKLIFFASSPVLVSCLAADGGAASTALVRPYFARKRIEFTGQDAVEFHLGHGEWVSHLGANGLVLEDLFEVQPPPDTQARYGSVVNEWAQHWPSEDIWIARKYA
jgi:SAM-dependent methyltransferase